MYTMQGMQIPCKIKLWDTAPAAVEKAVNAAGGTSAVSEITGPASTADAGNAAGASSAVAESAQPTSKFERHQQLMRQKTLDPNYRCSRQEHMAAINSFLDEHAPFYKTLSIIVIQFRVNQVQYCMVLP